MNKEEERLSFNKEEEGVQQQIKRIMFKIEFYKEKFSRAKQKKICQLLKKTEGFCLDESKIEKTE